MGPKLRADGALIAIYAKIIKVARCSGAVGEKSGKLAGKVRADGRIAAIYAQKGQWFVGYKIGGLIKDDKSLENNCIEFEKT